MEHFCGIFSKVWMQTPHPIGFEFHREGEGCLYEQRTLGFTYFPIFECDPPTRMQDETTLEDIESIVTLGDPRAVTWVDNKTVCFGFDEGMLCYIPFPPLLQTHRPTLPFVPSLVACNLFIHLFATISSTQNDAIALVPERA